MGGKKGIINWKGSVSFHREVKKPSVLQRGGKNAEHAGKNHRSSGDAISTTHLQEGGNIFWKGSYVTDSILYAVL